jgi:subtilisin family serine protease
MRWFIFELIFRFQTIFVRVKGGLKKRLFMKRTFLLLIIVPVFLHAAFEGAYLTLEELEAIKKGSFSSLTALQWYQNKQKNEKGKKQNNDSIFKQIKDTLFWHQWFPTTGLRLQKPYYPPPYPYIPHYFSVWQLAPKKGKDSTVAVLDTGVAAFSLKNDASFKKNHDLVVKMPVTDQNYNLISYKRTDPLENLIVLIKKFSDPQKFDMNYLKENISVWIQDFLKTGNTDLLRTYLLKYGKLALQNHGNLTIQGMQALEEITKGPHGISPNVPDSLKPFKLKQIADSNEIVVVEFLPLARINNSASTYIAGHGSHTLGLINAQFDGIDNNPDTDTGILGLAPDAQAFMIKAFDDTGVTKKSILFSALEKAVRAGATIVNLSLKIDDLDLKSQSTKSLQELIASVPYMICASGNSGNKRAQDYAGNVESYPARFASVPFDVGAFGLNSEKAFIAPFSQYEPDVGPLFVAPGVDILSAGLIPGQTFDSAYVFMSGTSMASSIMSGFVALMLGEFQNLFSREQLLKVCYCSAFKLHNTQEWREKVVLGVLDMRTALFILRALEYIKKNIKKTRMLDVEKKFDQLLAAVRMVLFSQPEEFGKKYLGMDGFSTSFMDFLNKAIEKNIGSKHEFFVPNSLNKALDYVSNTIFAALGYKIRGPKAPNTIIKSIKNVLETGSYNLFDTLSPTSQERITMKVFGMKKN